MQLLPNKTNVEGRVVKITPDEGGYGRTIEVSVNSAKAARGKQDFLNVTRGDMVSLFLAGPEKIEIGKSYRMATTVLGGPSGSRAVIESFKQP